MWSLHSIAPRLITVTYWKAKTLVVRTAVGTRPLDLRAYENHEVIFTWRND